MVWSFPSPPAGRVTPCSPNNGRGNHIPANDELIVTEHGPVIVLRQPGWRDDQPSQDVPLLVFTLDQWQAVQKGKFCVGAGGVCQEIMRNSKYVFAISSRFNANDSLKGWAEATNYGRAKPGCARAVLE